MTSVTAAKPAKKKVKTVHRPCPIHTTFEIISANIVADAHLSIYNDNCPVCKNDVTAQCPNCTGTDNECKSVLGICDHVYHGHCIQEWLTAGHTTCCLDNKRWEYKKHEMPVSSHRIVTLKDQKVDDNNKKQKKVDISDSDSSSTEE
jgi:RING-box protein 1